MSEIKPVYQSQTDGVWHDVRKADFDARSHCPDLFKQRILYPAAAHEALKAENERLRKKLEDVAEVIGNQSALDKFEIVDRVTSALVPENNGDSK